MNLPLIGLAKLMRRAFASENLQPTADELLQRINCDPSDANALLDLSTIFQLGGNPSLALEFQAKALSYRQHYRLQSSSAHHPLRVLAISSRGLIMDNMPVEFLLEHASIQLETLYLGEGIPAPRQIPEHDIAIVAVCESDSNQPLLAALEDIVPQWPKPVINLPGRIARLSRDRLGKVIGNTGHLEIVTSERVPRGDLEQPGSLDRLACRRDGAKEWIIRPVSTHAGHGLQRIHSAFELKSYLTENVAEQYYVAPFVDYRSTDGKYRKYRIALVGGKPYPVHMALSQHWMVHYLNADMLNNAVNRHEEAAFLEHYMRTFGHRHRRTLNHIAERIGLDYVVLDCAESRQGDLLLFEADNGAVVHSMDSAELFPYKRPAMQKIFDATQQLFWTQSRTFDRALAA